MLQRLTQGLFLLLWYSSVSAAASPPTITGFDFPRDTFAFENETYFTYDKNQKPIKRRATGPGPNAYSRQCFTISRAALQFYKFARFERNAPPIDPAEMQRRIRALCRTPAWLPAKPLNQRILFPGYANLRSFSSAQAELLQKNMGLWWPSYLRIGNARIPNPFPRYGQALAAKYLSECLQRGTPQTVFMTQFIGLNHNILLFDVQKLANGNLIFQAYDPNLNDRPRSLTFNAATSSFSYPKTFYFKGGKVNVFRTYISPIH